MSNPKPIDGLIPVYVLNDDIKMWYWCQHSCEKDTWTQRFQFSSPGGPVRGGTYYFEHESDATMFRLKWIR